MSNMIPAEHFIGTIAANVDNEKLTDADFRQFIRNTLPIVQYPRAPAREHSVEIGRCNNG